MAIGLTVSRFLLSKPNTNCVTKFLSSTRFFYTSPTSSLSRTRFISSLYGLFRPQLLPPAARALSIRAMSSSLDNSSPPPPPQKEMTSADGCDLKHWLVWCRKIDDYWPRDDQIRRYIKTLTFVLPSVEEAKKRVYSVSTKYYRAYGVLLSEKDANRLDSIDKCRTRIKKVILDPYVYEGKKEYQGEPFINGEAAPYDPKYHEAWVRINGEEEEVDEEDEYDRRIKEFKRRIEEEKESRDERNAKLYGVDEQHWQVFMHVPESLLSRDEIINSYIKTLAYVLGRFTWSSCGCC